MHMLLSLKGPATNFLSCLNAVSLAICNYFVTHDKRLLKFFLNLISPFCFWYLYLSWNKMTSRFVKYIVYFPNHDVQRTFINSSEHPKSIEMHQENWSNLILAPRHFRSASNWGNSFISSHSFPRAYPIFSQGWFLIFTHYTLIPLLSVLFY